MQFVIPLKQMSVEDKLQAIEEIWADLAGTPENVSSPRWHLMSYAPEKNGFPKGNPIFWISRTPKRL